MATLSFSCPKCQRDFKNVKAEMAGSKVKCQCGHVFRLGPKKTKPEQPKPKPKSTPRPKPAAAVRPSTSTPRVSTPRPKPARPASSSAPQPAPKSDAATVANASQPAPTPSTDHSNFDSPARTNDPDVDELIAIAGVPPTRPSTQPADSDSFDGLDDSGELDQLLAEPPLTTAPPPSTTRSPKKANHDSADDLLPVGHSPSPSPASRPVVGKGIDLKKKSSVGNEDDLELIDDDLELLDDDLELLDDDLELIEDELTLAPLPSAYSQGPDLAPGIAPAPSPYAAPAPNSFGGPMANAQPMPGGMPQAAPIPQAPSSYGNPYAPVGPTLQPSYSGSQQRYPSWVITAPGIAMIVCGSLDLLWVLFFMVRTFVLGVGVATLPQTEFGPPIGQAEKEFLFTSMIVSGAISLIFLAIALTVLMGGINMVKRTGYGRAMAGAICAILPCAIMDVVLLEIGIGIWATVVLCMEGYRRQFD